MRLFVGDKISPLMGIRGSNDLPFHLEKDRWELVNDINDADIIPLIRPPIVINRTDINLQFLLEDQLRILEPYFNTKWFLLMVHAHSSESMGDKTLQWYLDHYPTDRMFVVTPSLRMQTNRHIYNNFYYNFIKVLFTEYDKYDLKTDRLWISNCDKTSFVLNDLNKETNPSKKFLIPNIVRTDSNTTTEYKNYARIELAKRINPKESHYSDAQKNIWLLPEQVNLYPSAYRGNTGPGFVPIANKYYDDSLISVYVETIGRHIKSYNSSVSLISEKTYVPLIKGHFILPFGYPGLIRDIKDQGFKLPDWIDYSYDLIDNDDLRLQKFFESFDKLKNMSIDQLIHLSKRDLAIRKYNRQVFINSLYDSLFDKVKQATGL